MTRLNRDALAKYLSQKLGLDLSKLNDSTKLVSSGLIDSFDIASLASFIEGQCQIRIEPEDLTVENLDSIESIMKFSNRRARQQ